MFALAVPMLAAAALAATPSAGSACPASDRTPLVSQAPGASTSLVPPLADSLTVCRYTGLANPSSHAFRLAAKGATHNGGTIGGIGSELDAIRPSHGVIGCPADFGTKLLAFFGYRSGATDVVTIGLSGCNPITNGHVRRLGLGAPVIDQLARLAP